MGMLFEVYCYSGFLAIWTGNLLAHFNSLLKSAQGELQDGRHMSLRSHPKMQLTIQNTFLETMTQKDTCPTV